MNFTQLNFPEYKNIEIEMNNLLDKGIIKWKGNQICLTTKKGHEDDYTLGCGSLSYNWDTKERIKDARGSTIISLPKNDSGLIETDFVILCNQFKNTIFEDIFNMLSAHYKVGRLRLMKSEPKGCYTWHTDATPRLHYPIKTQTGCFMVIDDEIKHLPAHTWWLTDTVKWHTAFNGSTESRIHLVGAIL